LGVNGNRHEHGGSRGCGKTAQGGGEHGTVPTINERMDHAG
jgi:hypothetical protein